MVRTIVRIESLLILLASLLCYQAVGGDWWRFAILFMTPDVSIAGYLIDKKWGAYIYNVVHTYILAFAIMFIGMAYRQDLILQYGFILMGHIGMDRLIGFGLKYKTGFKHTHIQKL